MLYLHSIYLYLHTEEILEKINTISIILTRSIDTVSNISFTTFSGPTRVASTFVTSYFIFARPTVEARIRCTVINVSFTHFSCKSFATDALVFIIKIHTTVSSNGVAWFIQAFINGSFTLQSNKSWSAFANEAVYLINA